MPTQPPLQASASEPSGKSAQAPADAPPSGPGATAAKPARESTLFHLLVERGWDAALAYTADQRVHAMTSEIAAAGLRPVLVELRQIRETMAGFATKADLAGFATKADLASFATKADLASFATKADLADFATKADLTSLRREMAEREVRLMKWMFGAMLAQTAVIVGLVVGVVPLLK